MRAALLSLLLVCSWSAAQDLPGLLQLLRQSERFDVRGDVTSSVYFPPRQTPTRSLTTLPRVEFVPWLVRRNYTLSGPVSDVIAERDSKRFDLTPRNVNASRWTIWLDAEWNVPLAYEERSPNGELVRRAAFDRVQNEPRRRLALPAMRVQDPAFRRAVLAALPGVRLPAGFEPVGLMRSQRGLEIALSDGINVLALVIAGRNVKEGEGVFSRRVGDRFVWLVGNLPAAQLRASLSGVQSIRQGTLGTFVPQSDSNS